MDEYRLRIPGLTKGKCRFAKLLNGPENFFVEKFQDIGVIAKPLHEPLEFHVADGVVRKGRSRLRPEIQGQARHLEFVPSLDQHLDGRPHLRIAGPNCITPQRF